LKNPVPVLALFDEDAAHEVMLRNLLQRKGYESLEAARAEGRAKRRAEEEARGWQEALLVLLAARGLRVSKKAEEQIRAMTDKATLDRWVARVIKAASVAEVLSEGKAKVPRHHQSQDRTPVEPDPSNPRPDSPPAEAGRHQKRLARPPSDLPPRAQPSVVPSKRVASNDRWHTSARRRARSHQR
jgi:hypothetical protein